MGKVIYRSTSEGPAVPTEAATATAGYSVVGITAGHAVKHRRLPRNARPTDGIGPLAVVLYDGVATDSRVTVFPVKRHDSTPRRVARRGLNCGLRVVQMTGDGAPEVVINGKAAAHRKARAPSSRSLSH